MPPSEGASLSKDVAAWPLTFGGDRRKRSDFKPRLSDANALDILAHFRRPAPAPLALLAAAALFAPAPASASASALSFFGCSDVHFGHDVVAKDNTTTTALALNRAAVAEMNALGTPNNDSWPDALGGGPVLPPVGLVITGDLIDNGWSTSKRPPRCARRAPALAFAAP